MKKEINSILKQMLKKNEKKITNKKIFFDNFKVINRRKKVSRKKVECTYGSTSYVIKRNSVTSRNKLLLLLRTQKG